MGATPDTMRQVPLPLGAAAPQRLDDFIPAEALPWPQLQAVLSDPRPGVPVLLWGVAGSGKSHLLHAAAALAHGRGLRVAAFDAAVALPWTLPEDAGLIVLDDCDRYDAPRQHAAFLLFVEAATRGLPVLAAARVPPVDLPVREDLRTRLGWGLVYQLVPPAEPRVRGLLRREADRRGILLGDEVMDYLLARSARDLASLMRLLQRLDEFSLSQQRAVTIPLLRQLLALDGAAPPDPTQP